MLTLVFEKLERTITVHLPFCPCVSGQLESIHARPSTGDTLVM